MNQSSDNVLSPDTVSHEWLLPRCKLIVHHCDAGTTSAGLRASIPHIVIPFAVVNHFEADESTT